MLLACWSPKGGSGTSVFVAACALSAARDGMVRIADLGGDQPAILGLTEDPPTGLREWLAVGVTAPVDALGRLAVPAGPQLRLLPAGSARVDGLDPEAGAALAVALREETRLTIVDAATADTPALEAVVDVADASVVVVRGCYLALRRAVRRPEVARAAGAVLVEEAGRALGAREVSDVLGIPVLAKVPVRSSTARAIDAGVLAARLPESLMRPARTLLDRIGASGGREGRAA
ncbi:MAG TPA: hypothetical protein VFX21_00155 [Acidimicrobiia bacterium]|nr:hypothetical protein [Acidimicrobiia bacterium]